VYRGYEKPSSEEEFESAVGGRVRVRDIGINIAGHLYLCLGVTIASVRKKIITTT